MGAHNIEFVLEKKASWRTIENAFNEQRKADAEYNGSQDGYSGDFQTVNTVLNHTFQVFNSYKEAHEYCLNHAEKWTSVVAVYYRSIPQRLMKRTKSMDKLSVKISSLKDKLMELEKRQVKLAKFVTCEGCHSKVATKHLRLRSTMCPVCGEGDFRPLWLQRKIVKLNKDITTLGSKWASLLDKQRARALAKLTDKDICTLIAGWGAS